MDPRVMELRIKKWIPVIEEQAKSGMSKKEWCAMHGINRTSFFRWQKRVRKYLLDQCKAQPSQHPSSIPSKELSKNNFSYCLSFSPIAPLKNQLHSPLCA